MKKIFLLIWIWAGVSTKAQKIDSIYVNLYTDSLKKGTFNYINIDGLLSNGKYLPLDSSIIQFSSSAGKFFGNSLWIEHDFRESKVDIEVTVKKNLSLHKKFTLYIKKKEDDELKTMEEIMRKN